MKLRVYGCRGSAVFSRSSHYGGNTTCMVLESGNSMILLDAGSGLIKLDAELRKQFPGYPNDVPFELSLLLSHLHIDHINGIIWFTPIWSKESGMRIFTCSRDDRPLNEQVFGIFKPPYWPLDMAKVSQAECCEVSGPFKIGELTITPFAANHADKTQSFHITDGQKTLVYSLDNEMPEQDTENTFELVKYCNNADMVVFDAAYLPKDYPPKRGWGHSTVQDGVSLADVSGCKRLMFAHYGHEYTDDELDTLHEGITGDKRFVFAREGVEIDI